MEKKISYEEALKKLDKIKEINKRAYLRRQARINVVLRKAAEMKIVATEEEIAEELKRMGK